MAVAAAGGSAAPAGGPKDVYVVADLQTLREGGSCEMDGAPVPASIVRQILEGGDAFLIGVLKNGVEVQRVVRWGRYVPAEVRDALLIRDGFRCSYPGCSQKARLQRDHLQPYSKNGPTSLTNLQLLCPFHHKLKTARDRLFDPDAAPPTTHDTTENPAERRTGDRRRDGPVRDP
ncbi:MAG: HNH endonuclease [Acidimicrobiia bacterium]|nr:HNH endonuclease [Acidimicrobiia bacterium]